MAALPLPQPMIDALLVLFGCDPVVCSDGTPHRALNSLTHSPMAVTNGRHWCVHRRPPTREDSRPLSLAGRTVPIMLIVAGAFLIRR